MNPRDQLLELVDIGAVDARHALLCCVKWLSHDDCSEIMRINELDNPAGDQYNSDHLYDILVDTGQPAMYLDANNKNDGFDDWDRANNSGRAYCIRMLPEVIPVDIDAEHFDYLDTFRQIIAADGAPYLEMMSGGPASPNRHFFVHVPDERRRNALLNELQRVCGAKPIRYGQKIRPPLTPHRNGRAMSVPTHASAVDDFVLWVEGVLV